MTVELYSKEHCVQCTQSKKTLDKLGVEYRITDLMADETALSFVTETLGYRAAPVVVVRDEDGNIADSWAGFNPEKLQSLAD